MDTHAAAADGGASNAGAAAAAAMPATAAGTAAAAAAIGASAATPSASVHPSEVALLVDHYLSQHYPRVRPLFRLEAKAQLQAVDTVRAIECDHCDDGRSRCQPPRALRSLTLLPLCAHRSDRVRRRVDCKISCKNTLCSRREQVRSTPPSPMAFRVSSAVCSPLDPLARALLVCICRGARSSCAFTSCARRSERVRSGQRCRLSPRHDDGPAGRSARRLFGGSAHGCNWHCTWRPRSTSPWRGKLDTDANVGDCCRCRCSGDASYVAGDRRSSRGRSCACACTFLGFATQTSPQRQSAAAHCATPGVRLDRCRSDICVSTPQSTPCSCGQCVSAAAAASALALPASDAFAPSSSWCVRRDERR